MTKHKITDFCTAVIINTKSDAKFNILKNIIEEQLNESANPDTLADLTIKLYNNKFNVLSISFTPSREIFLYIE